MAPHKKAKKRDAFEEWLCRRNGKGTVTDEFRRYSAADSAIHVTGKFDLKHGGVNQI